MAGLGAYKGTRVNRLLQNANGEIVIDTQRVAQLLVYPSANAVRQAHRRGSLPIPLFRVGGRRRLFARLIDVENLLRNGLQQAHPPAPKGALTKEEVS